MSVVSYASTYLSLVKGEPDLDKFYLVERCEEVSENLKGFYYVFDKTRVDELSELYGSKENPAVIEHFKKTFENNPEGVLTLPLKKSSTTATETMLHFLNGEEGFLKHYGFSVEEELITYEERVSLMGNQESAAEIPSIDDFDVSLDDDEDEEVSDVEETSPVAESPIEEAAVIVVEEVAPSEEEVVEASQEAVIEEASKTVFDELVTKNEEPSEESLEVSEISPQEDNKDIDVEESQEKVIKVEESSPEPEIVEEVPKIEESKEEEEVEETEPALVEEPDTTPQQEPVVESLEVYENKNESEVLLQTFDSFNKLMEIVPGFKDNIATLVTMMQGAEVSKTKSIPVMSDADYTAVIEQLGAVAKIDSGKISKAFMVATKRLWFDGNKEVVSKLLDEVMFYFEEEVG